MARRKTIDRTVEHLWRLNREGRSEEMREAAAVAVARFPRDPEVNLLYGVALSFTKPDLAPWQLATAISLDKNQGWRVVIAANMLTSLGQIEAARNYVEHAKTLPADEAVRAGLAEVDRRLLALEEEGA